MTEQEIIELKISIASNAKDIYSRGEVKGMCQALKLSMDEYASQLGEAGFTQVNKKDGYTIRDVFQKEFISACHFYGGNLNSATPYFWETSNITSRLQSFDKMIEFLQKQLN